MGFHTRQNIQNVRDRLLSVRPDLYIYGEGWEFGSGLSKGLEVASQFGASGLGVGMFNDKIRDSLTGGSSEDPDALRAQGFINGLSYDWNGGFYDGRDRDALLRATDVIKVGIAGNLQDFTFINRYGQNQTGVSFDGTAYARDPSETIQYVSAHDDHCLWDKTAFKAPHNLSPEDRGRIQNLAISVVSMSQGIPFFTAGIEMMRSKSLDRNTYDSGDWFNTLDFSMDTHNFPRGLPPLWTNERLVPATVETIGLSIAPEPPTIRRSFEHLLEFLRIRKSSPLFRLGSLEEIQAIVRFFNNGPSQVSAVIPFMLYDKDAPIVVIINADKFVQEVDLGFDSDVRSFDFALHPVLQDSTDLIVRQASASAGGVFVVPARTAAVFVGSNTGCSVRLQDRQECGFFGIDAVECVARDCCWAPDHTGSAPWCFSKQQ